MPVNKSMKKVEAVKGLTAVRRPGTGQKAPGTRAGTLEDWREGSSKAGKPIVRRGTAIRDGR